MVDAAAKPVVTFTVSADRKSVATSKGLTWYFHKVGYLQHFSKKAEGALVIPPEMEVVINQMSGMPIARKIKK